MRRALLGVLPLAVLGTLARPASPESPWFPAGTRWVALGDSITQGGSYHQQVESFLATHYPDRELTVLNAGISGDTAAGALGRLDWDVFPRSPTLVTVMFGMNDVARYLYAAEPPDPRNLAQRAAKLDAWEKSVREIVRLLEASGARVVLCAPSPFDETVQSATANNPGVNGALAECARRLPLIAHDTGAAWVDFHSPMAAINVTLQRKDPSDTVVGPGRVHPGSEGHLVMAYLLLRAAGASGEVATLSVDANALTTSGSNRCTLSGVRRENAGLAFTAREEGLPSWVPPEARRALTWVPWRQELDREVLTVQGLTGRFELRIDDQMVGTFSGAELAAGVNLAELPDTPQLRQSRQVHEALRRRWAAAAKLRRIAYCEYRAWTDEPRPVDPARMPEKIARWLDRLKADASFRYVEGESRLYVENKREQSDLERALVEGTRLARQAATPVARRFALMPVTNP